MQTIAALSRLAPRPSPRVTVTDRVVEAFTLRSVPAREDLNPITVFDDRQHPQRRTVERRRGDFAAWRAGCGR